ncbi:hypothetical protein GCM10027093_04090 [Paraburkholderia jirisanensis]
MKELHISRRAYFVLVRAGMLRPVEVGVRQFVPRDLLADLCRRMEDVSRPYPTAATHLYPLFGTLIAAASNGGAVSIKLLNEAFAGKFPIYRQIEAPGLAAFFVDETALERVRILKRFYAARRRHKANLTRQIALAL